LERFHLELQKTLENIAGPNTDPTKVRKITLTAKLKADENRDVVNFEVESKAYLVSAKSLSTKIIIDRDNDGSVVGAELLSGEKGQTFLDVDGIIKDDKGNVVNFKKY